MMRWLMAVSVPHATIPSSLGPYESASPTKLGDRHGMLDPRNHQADREASGTLPTPLKRRQPCCASPTLSAGADLAVSRRLLRCYPGTSLAEEQGFRG